MAQPIKITSRIRLRDFDPDDCGVVGVQPAKGRGGRHEEINTVRKMLPNPPVVLVKFFLHISKDAQAERFRERLENATKHWKFSVADVKMRERWNEFQSAYEDAI